MSRAKDPCEISWKEAISLIRSSTVSDDAGEGKYYGFKAAIVTLDSGDQIYFVSEYEYSPAYSSWTPSDWDALLPKCYLVKAEVKI